MRLVVRAAAEADILEAARWYEERSPGLGTEFLRAVDVTLAETTRLPERYPSSAARCAARSCVASPAASTRSSLPASCWHATRS